MNLRSSIDSLFEALRATKQAEWTRQTRWRDTTPFVYDTGKILNCVYICAILTSLSLEKYFTQPAITDRAIRIFCMAILIGQMFFHIPRRFMIILLLAYTESLRLLKVPEDIVRQVCMTYYFY